MKLSELKIGESAVIVKVEGHGGFRRRIVEMGFVKGHTVEALARAPLGDPTEYAVMGYKVSLRSTEASRVEVITPEEARIEAEQEEKAGTAPEALVITEEYVRSVAMKHRREISVALVGNPNAGKTSLFNVISGMRERVGNYSGVTVDAKETLFDYKGYKIRLVDLPGTYSISAYSPEERYVRSQIVNGRPDVVVNVIDSGNIERNMFLTAQLIDMNLRMVVALNMYDELEKKGDRFDYKDLAGMIGVPMVPTVSIHMKGIHELFDTVIKVYEGEEQTVRHVHINYGAELENKIDRVKRALADSGVTFEDYTARYMAITMLSHDEDIMAYVRRHAAEDKYTEVVEKCREEIKANLKDSPENAFQDAKYGFISGALKETYHARERRGGKTMTEKIDNVVTSRIWGYPIFIAIIFIMFEATFVVGQYPQMWIAMGVSWFAEWVDSLLPGGVLSDMLVGGIIQGVGGVLVFLPNILILYFFINLMEASGYMARAAFIMDKVMHHIGLHGRSFIPLIMGFGCNVPAIMATRTIENRNARMITILIIPLMACSARLPIFVLFSAAFFPPEYAGLMLLLMYLVGVVLAAMVARLFRRVLFSKEEVPFVMELPPYRFPTFKMLMRDTWDKCVQYLKKIGTTILLGSIIIWALSYFPMAHEGATETERLEQSYIARISKAIEPAVRPLGFDWKGTAALVSGVAAKEIVVSTMGILYEGSSDESLGERMQAELRPDGTPVWDLAAVLSFMLFALIYIPCIATLGSIRVETKSIWWALFGGLYTIVLAYAVSFTVYQSIENGVWQEVTVALVLLVAVVEVVKRIVRFARRKPRNVCAGCDEVGCDVCPNKPK